MLLTLKQAETALLAACTKHSAWQEAVGIRTRIFRVAPDFDCDNLPGQFEVLWRNGNECVVAERIDDLEDFFKSLWPGRSN